MKQQEVFLILTIGTLIFILLTSALLLFLIHHKRKQQHHITEKMNLEHQYQSQLLQTRLEVQEQAFKYLSEEIHDNVGQALSMIKLQLYALNQQATAESKPLIAATLEVLSKAINDLRNISHNLHGGYVSMHGLQEAVEKEIAYINGAKTIHAHLEIVGDSYSLGKEKELLIFRIIQEALNNAIKHASASSVSVILKYLPQQFTAIVQDNGSGFDADKKLENGMGLSNMRTRATLLNAVFNLNSSDNGTTISLNINL